MLSLKKMASSSEGVLSFVKLSALTGFVGTLDYWLWPQLNSERLMQYNNITAVVAPIQPSNEQMKLYLDDFFDQWHTQECLHSGELQCEFYLFLATYALYGMGTFAICAMMHKMPRFGLAYAIADGSFFWLQSFVIAIVVLDISVQQICWLWRGAVAGSVVTQWRCLQLRYCVFKCSVIECYIRRRGVRSCSWNRRCRCLQRFGGSNWAAAASFCV